MGKKPKISKQEIIELCIAHDELVQTREIHRQKTNTSNILTDIFDQQLRAIESEITDKVKHWLGCIKKK
jgi:hypothetical protein